MNLQTLNHTMNESMSNIIPDIDQVFNTTIDNITKTGRSVNVKSFIDKLNHTLKPHRVKVVREVDDSFGTPQDTGNGRYPAMGGFCYEPAKSGKLARIELIICTHSSTNRLPPSIALWQYFKFKFFRVLVHEMVHRAQYANGRKLVKSLVFRPHANASLNPMAYNEQYYLGDIDEVEAYARDCVEEWHYLRPNQTLTMRSIKEDFRNSRKLPAVQYYYDTFAGDEYHPSVQRFFRKVNEWNKIITPIASLLPSPDGDIGVLD